MLQVSRLFIYPIKSLGGIELTSAQVTDRGFLHDRRWMLADQHNRFLSQRKFAAMALLKVAITVEGLTVSHAHYPNSILQIPIEPQTNDSGKFVIWDDTVTAQYVSRQADEWFDDMLKTKCRLVYMPDSSMREVNNKHASASNINSFSDAYPFMMLGQSSLDDLNGRLEEKLPVNRFRPNIVFTGGEAFEEDGMAHFTINNIDFYGVKLCGRCNVITINQDTLAKSKEPTKTLATYRMKNHNVYFGHNLVHKGNGVVHVGDALQVFKIKAMFTP